MNNFEQPLPQSATERRKEQIKAAEEEGRKLQERRAQREAAAKEAAEKRFALGSRATERIAEIEREMLKERARSAAPEVKAPVKADEEDKEARWKAAAVKERETSMEKMHKLFTRHGGTEQATSPEKEAETAEQSREDVVREISQHLVERPGEALDIFRKGVGLRLEKATIGFTSFWKKAGAEALKGASWPAEKVVGSSLAKLNEMVWAAQEYLLTRPGAKRLEKVLAIQANIEALKKSGVITEEQAESLLKNIMKQYHGASGDVSVENNIHLRWEEGKKRTLGAMKTFGHLGEKLSKWGKRQKAEAADKKETAKQKRAGKIAEKF